MWSTGVYGWSQVAQREGWGWPDGMAKAMGLAKSAGLDAWEPFGENAEAVRRAAKLAEEAGLATPSMYAGGILHDEGAAAIVEGIVEAARAARDHGTRVVVVNPNPIRWGGPENKSDAQLRTQAAHLQRLGERLRDLGLALAYHTHDPEMRAAAREFHHMLVATDPAVVKLCFDAHWIYRGAEDSNVAMLDIARLYGDRVVHMHLRQSHGGVWSETIGDGDVDYPALVEVLRERGARPLLVLERAIEKGTPSTMPWEDAERRSLAYLRDAFAPLTRP